MNSLIKYSISLILFCIAFPLQADLTSDYYQSNYNGLQLVKIPQQKSAEQRFLLKVDLSDDLVLLKTLYRDKLEIKRWKFVYQDRNPIEEYYYKDRILKEEYRYDLKGHKVKMVEYLNRKKFKEIVYSYNQSGLVSREEQFNLITKELVTTLYKYDQSFKIKQIEKQYPDKRIVFWEAFFNPKGIVLREYYTLKDEVYKFFYNDSGQELNGEVVSKLPDKTENLKIKWVNFYFKNGMKEKKELENFLINKKTVSWFNKNLKEIKVETYYHNKIESIEEFEYDDANKVTYYKKIVDLNLSEIYYTYGADGSTREMKIYENKELKKEIFFRPDNTRTEVIYASNQNSITVEYGKDGKLKR